MPHCVFSRVHLPRCVVLAAVRAGTVGEINLCPAPLWHFFCILDSEELMSIWIHCSSSLIRSQRKNATSLSHVLNLLNNRNGIEKKSAPFLGGVDTSWWLKARFLVQAPRRAGQGPVGTSSWLGWAPARQVCVAPNLPAVQRDGRKGEAQALGQAACSPLRKAASFQTGSAFGWTGAPHLPNVASGKAPSLSRSVSSPALKILL